VTTRHAGATGTPGAICPSCERFIGPAKTCPYCDADSAQPPVWRALRWGALLLAMAGLVFLYLMARFREVQTLKVGDVNPMMNFAVVRVAGKVARNAYVARENSEGQPSDVSYVSFTLDDGSGQLRVTAYRDVARVLDATGRVPKKGAAVDVTGSLNVAADGKHTLRLQAADQLRIMASGEGGG
jgi:hypothetical protein